MSFYYPPLDEATIKALATIRPLIQENPNYFKESTYTLEVEHLLSQWFRAPVAVVTEDGRPVETPLDSNAPPPPIFEGLRQEITSAYLHLKSAKEDKHQDKVAYAKTAVSLLEKLVKMESMVVNIEMVGAFQQAVIAFMNETCTEKQIKDFMARVKEFLAPDTSHISEVIAITELPSE